MNHTSLLNFLAAKIKKKEEDPHYAEIGVQSLHQNFNKINIRRKIGIDPAVTGPDVYTGTSDKYFEENLSYLVKEKNRGDGFHLVFIDGLHHADQVERDFNNSLQCLSDDGYIVIHDCLPVEEITSLVPRQSKCWHGDVYRFIMKLHTYAGIDFVTLNMDNGCCVVWKEPGKEPNTKLLAPIDWKSYQTFGKAIMNVIEPSVFFQSAKLNSVI
jgi:hypothetical protein